MSDRPNTASAPSTAASSEGSQPSCTEPITATPTAANQPNPCSVSKRSFS